MTSLAVPSSCVVTQTPMATNSGTRRRKCKFLLLFVNYDRGRIEIDHLYGLRCRGWYCNPEQHSLCRPARPQATAGTTRAVPDCSTNHSSADRIMVNSYISSHYHHNYCTSSAITTMTAGVHTITTVIADLHTITTVDTDFSITTAIADIPQ